MALTNTTAGTNYCFGNPVTASVANLVTTNSRIIITTTYTNAAGAVTTNCPPMSVTNTVAPVVVANLWTVSGPGGYTNSGAGLSATFTPTNAGSGIVLFTLTYASKTPCATNVQTAPPVRVPFNVVLPADAGFYIVAPEATADTPKIALFRRWLIDSVEPGAVAPPPRPS